MTLFHGWIEADISTIGCRHLVNLDTFLLLLLYYGCFSHRGVVLQQEVSDFNAVSRCAYLYGLDGWLFSSLHHSSCPTITLGTFHPVIFEIKDMHTHNTLCNMRKTTLLVRFVHESAILIHVLSNITLKPSPSTYHANQSTYPLCHMFRLGQF